MKKKIFFAVTSLVLAICICFCVILIHPSEKYPAAPETDSVEFVKNLGSGWNLGNTLDACEKGSAEKAGLETENMWGNPDTTKEMIEYIAQSGFSTVRIPITWAQHIGSAPDYKIDDEWLDRVNEIVDWVLDCGMYAIINVHHDDVFWLITDNEHSENAALILTKIWQQVSERFASYDERLIFEVMNEPRVSGVLLEWLGNKEYRNVVNMLNAEALETIRNSGGNNQTRYVMIPTYAASSTMHNMNALELPEDERIIVSMHYYYKPDRSTDTFKLYEKIQINKTFRRMYKYFLSKGVGVVIGEFGWTDRDNLENLSEKTAYYVNEASKFGISCIVWDDGGNYRLLDRASVKWEFEEYAAAVIVK